jgi:protoporphyrinogen oxidase
LAGQQDVIRSATVEKIAILPDGSGVKVTYRQNGAEAVADADLVVVAVPGDAVLGLFPEPRPAWKPFFNQVHYTTSVKVYFIAEGDAKALDHGAIMFPLKEPWQIAPLGWDRRQDGRIFGMSALRADVYDPAMSDEEIIRLVNTDMVRAEPAFAGHITAQMVFRWPRKVPTFRPGYLSALRAFKQAMQEGPVYFCGDYLVGPSAGSALASGWQCADRVLRGAHS